LHDAPDRRIENRRRAPLLHLFRRRAFGENGLPQAVHPMNKLDRLVTDHLVGRLCGPVRLTETLSSMAGRQAEKEQSVNSRLPPSSVTSPTPATGSSACTSSSRTT
jgi:hypothetical protein